MTLVVNLFAGPGTGKSTTAALVFGKLKAAGVNCELVHEFAKDLVWEQRHKALENQSYVLGKQIHHITRLFDQVDVIITDSPVLLSGWIYGQKSDTIAMPQLRTFAMETFLKWKTYNLFLVRNAKVHPYNPRGRNQNEDEAREVDNRIYNMLIEHVSFEAQAIEEGEKTADAIVAKVLERLA